MTNHELKIKALKLSGLPPCKNKKGIGAYRWLADHVNVHPSTMARYLRGVQPIPQRVVDRIRQLEIEDGLDTSQEWDEGYGAAHNGATVSECPYPFGVRRDDWIDGAIAAGAKAPTREVTS